MEWLFFAAYTVLSGAQQGIIVWLLREYVPEDRKEWIDAAYHYGGALIYALLVGYAARQVPSAEVPRLAFGALLIRALLFDPSLNTARSWFNHREGREWGHLFEVGTTALGDRAVRWLAPHLRLSAEHLRAALWLLSLAGALAVYFLLPA